jgi:hypothetical protein
MAYGGVMTARVYYHHPEDSQYSLAYVTQDKDDITISGQDVIIERYELDEEFFVLYTNRGASGTVEDLDDEFEDVLDEMSPQDRTITVRLLQIFEEIIEEKELEEEAELEIYRLSRRMPRGLTPWMKPTLCDTSH